MVLLLDDFTVLDMKGIEDVKRFSVCERNFPLRGDPSGLTCIVTHHFHAAERGQYACEEIKDCFPSANQCALAARWIERSPKRGIVCPRNAGNVFRSETIEVRFDGLLRIISALHACEYLLLPRDDQGVCGVRVRRGVYELLSVLDGILPTIFVAVLLPLHRRGTQNDSSGLVSIVLGEVVNGAILTILILTLRKAYKRVHQTSRLSDAGRKHEL